MPLTTRRLKLTRKQRSRLTAITRRRSVPASAVFRARIILGLAEGRSYRTLQEQLHTTAVTIAHWRRRFEQEGMAGLVTFHPGRPPSKLTPPLRAKVLAKTRERPPDGSTHWSCRKLASVRGLSKTLVHGVWQEADLQPHRLERYMASHDPEFENKAADIIGLYVDPPRHAAVFCVDEKTGIQALDRRDPCLPLSPGRAERHGFGYYRHGTLSLYAALGTQTGVVMGKTAPRHTSAEFVSFLSDLVASRPAQQEIHIILDNLSAHKTARVKDFLASHPNVHLHFTPTYASWLNQVELRFAKIERDVIARGIFTSVQDLARKIMRYIRYYSKTAKPIRWKYSDIRNRIRLCSTSLWDSPLVALSNPDAALTSWTPARGQASREPTSYL